jgi:hypothetical protein
VSRKVGYVTLRCARELSRRDARRMHGLVNGSMLLSLGWLGGGMPPAYTPATEDAVRTPDGSRGRTKGRPPGVAGLVCGELERSGEVVELAPCLLELACAGLELVALALDGGEAGFILVDDALELLGGDLLRRGGGPYRLDVRKTVDILFAFQRGVIDA